MSDNLTPLTRRDAIRRVRDAGYTVLWDTGEAGDEGYGSRLYYCRPHPTLNRHGQPLKIATISRVGGDWYVRLPR